MNATKSLKQDSIKKEFKKLLANNSDRFANEKQKKILKNAFDFAYNAHKNMNRYSGEPYIVHPLSVAKIVLEQIGLGAKSGIAALLHDVPEKTEYGIEDIRRYFGKKIALIVEDLNKIKYNEYSKNNLKKEITPHRNNKKHFEENPQASTFREILLSISDDIRVIFIKIADRLHNMRTIEYLSHGNKEKLVREVLTIYAPLSHRLGLYQIKAELEDLCLKHSNSECYDDINNKIKITEQDRIELINKFTKPIKNNLDKSKIKYRIDSRVKSVYSIWKKMQKKRIPFEEVYDLFAFRIILSPKNPKKEIKEIKNIAGIITQLYREKKDRRREWLDNPKDTGYQALHLTVRSKEEKWVEVQIRSEKMHEIAEQGLAAHWKYKGLKEVKSEFDDKVKEILEQLAKNNSSSEDFLDNLKLNLFSSKIRVFTPKNHIVTLPKGASVLDFAFKIHTDLAYKCIAAKINGVTTSVDTILKNGDKIEIITSQKQQPQKDWLNFVITQKALTGLKNAFRKEIKAEYDKGEKIINNILKNLNIPNVTKAKKLLVKELSNIVKKNDFFISVGKGQIAENDLTEIIKKCSPKRQSRFWKVKIPFVKEQNNPNSSGNNFQINYTIASCCNPLPGDKATAIKRYNSDKVEIHKTKCSVALVHNNRFDVEWTSYTAISILYRFKIQGKNSKGIINKISYVISNDLSINIKSFNFTSSKSKFNIDTILQIKENEIFENSEKIKVLINKLEKIKDIENVMKI